jgi:hypothetical protein
MYESSTSSIIGGQYNQISGLTNVHIIGTNITGTTSDTTYVNNLNLYDTPDTGTTYETILFRDTDGSVKTTNITSLTDDTFVTGGTLNTTTLRYTRNDGTNIDVDLSSLDGPFTTSGTNTRILPKNNTGNTNLSNNSTIAGGINNSITGAYGYANRSRYSFIGGGQQNQIVGGYGYGSQSRDNTILGGRNNTIYSDPAYAVYNIINTSTISSGYQNRIETNNGYNTVENSGIFTGRNNLIRINATGVFGNSSITNGSVIIGGRDNLIDATITSFDSNYNIIGAGQGNDIIDSDNSSIIGGANNYISGLTNVHIIGSNITATTSNTTYVEGFNIGTVVTANTVNDLLVRDVDGTTKVRTVSSVVNGLNGKYVESFDFTGGTKSTITHNLGSTDVLVQVKDPLGQLITPDVVDTYATNSVDIEVSITGTYRVIIIG